MGPVPKPRFKQTKTKPAEALGSQTPPEFHELHTAKPLVPAGERSLLEKSDKAAKSWENLRPPRRQGLGYQDKKGKSPATGPNANPIKKLIKKIEPEGEELNIIEEYLRKRKPTDKRSVLIMHEDMIQIYQSSTKGLGRRNEKTERTGDPGSGSDKLLSFLTS